MSRDDEDTLDDEDTFAMIGGVAVCAALCIAALLWLG
jgi:hypothetical protein